VQDKTQLLVIEGTHMGELAGFDYHGRGYHLHWRQ